MEFVNKWKYQENKLNTNRYVLYILKKLRREDRTEIEIDTTAKENFYLSIPLNFAVFLSDSSRIINENSHSSVFSDINVDYLISVIYVGLGQEDLLNETDSTPVQAITLFLTINSKLNDIIKIEKIISESVFNKIFKVLETRLFIFKKISGQLLLLWNEFLSTNQNAFDTEKLVKILHLVLLNDSLPIGKMESDDTSKMSNSEIAFTCFKTLVMNTLFEKKYIVTIIALRLVEDCTDDTINQNVAYIFQSLLSENYNEDWYIPLLVMLLKYIENKGLYVKIINQLPPKHHGKIVNVIINKYVELDEEDDDGIETYLNVMKYMIELPHDSIPDERRQKLVSRIMTQVYYRCARTSHFIRERIMILFTHWCQMRDIYVRRYIQQLLNSNDKISAACLFEILKQDVDISWRGGSFNTDFITFTCRFFITNKIFITQYRMRFLEMLAYKGGGHLLKPSMPVMIELIKHYAKSFHPILKPLLTFIISNATSGSSIAQYYMKEFHGLIENSMVKTEDSDLEFCINNVIMSDDFDCLELFKTLQTHGYIRPEHIEVLLQEKILKYPSTWRFLTILLVNTECTKFPPFMEHYLEKCESASFFMWQESLYMVQAMSKIFAAKISKNLIEEGDKKLAGLVENYFLEHVKKLMVPIKQIGEVLILILNVNKITKSSLEWSNELFKTCLKFVFDNVTSDMSIVLARYLMHLEQTLILFDLDMDEEDIARIFYVMDVDRQPSLTFDSVHAGLVTFLGKICMKYPSNIEPAVPLLKYAMIHSSSSLVQMVAVSCLYDICNLRLHCFDSLYDGIFTLMKSRNMDLKNMSVKMLVKLVNDDHIHLTCSDFVTLILVLVERTYRICPHFVNMLENNFIHRNQHTISKYFVNLLFYLNYYKDHPLYSVPPIDGLKAEYDFTYERRLVVYKLLYCNLARTDQLQILNILNEEYLLPFYNGRINPTSSNLNIIRDILTLICFYSSEQAPDNVETDDAELFYAELFDDMKRNFFTNKRFEETALDLDRTLENLLLALIKFLYQTETAYKNMFPTVFASLCIITRALFHKITQIVHGNKKLMQYYYELENCYKIHKTTIKDEPLDILRHSDKEEMRLYLKSQTEESY